MWRRRRRECDDLILGNQSAGLGLVNGRPSIVPTDSPNWEINQSNAALFMGYLYCCLIRFHNQANYLPSNPSTQSLHSFHSTYPNPTCCPSYVTNSPFPSRHARPHEELFPLHPALRINDTSVSSFVQPCSTATSGR